MQAGGADFQPPLAAVPVRVTGTPQHRAKAELAADSGGGAREGGWGALVKAGVPPGPLICDRECTERLPGWARPRRPGLCSTQCPIKSAHPPSPLMLQIIHRFPQVSARFQSFEQPLYLLFPFFSLGR